MFSVVVAEVLRDDNYENWSECVTSYLEAQGLWDIVIATTGPPNREDGEEEFENWRRKNAAALHAIQISCSPKMLSRLRGIKSAKDAWNLLAKMHETKSLQNQVTETETETEEDEDDEYAEFQPLVQAIYRGDLDGVKDFIQQNPDAKCAKINYYGNRAIHVAIDGGQDEIAKELVQLMSPEKLIIQNNRGNTALHRAAVCGNVKVAKCIISENNSVLSIGDEDGTLPILKACAEGQTKMARYLYSVIPIELLNGSLGASLITNAIGIKLFDVALDVIRKYPHLATFPSIVGNIPLTTLARKPLLFPSSNRLIFWKRIIYHCIHVKLPASSNDFCIHIPQDEESDKEKSLFRRVIGQAPRMSSILLKFFGVKELYDMKLNQLYAIEILKFMCQNLSSYNSRVSKAFFEAVEHGIVEFVVELCKANPQLLDDVDENGRTFFFLATRLRHENIFNLIYGLNKRKNSITSGVDKFENCLLHLVGMLAPPSQIAHISGPALKMQRELQWYKEIESLFDSSS